MRKGWCTMSQRNNEVTCPQPLLDKNGNIAEPGWARSQVQAYHRADITAPKFRIKEWDYYLVLNRDFAVCFTVSDLGYMGMLSASFLDFTAPREHTETILTPFPMGKPKYKSVNEAELFEFHDAEIRPLQLQNSIFRGVIEHLNIHGHTTHNPEEFDRELDSALLHMDRFRLAEEDGGLIDVMRHQFTVLKLDVEKADGHFLAKLEAVTEKHKPFCCTFHFDTIKITWNYYRGKAWYVKPTQ